MAIIVTDWLEFITAVGTSGAEVEFPKRLTRTQDRSVDPNKLYTDENGVVQTNVQPSDLANLYENTFKLDANDYAPEGLASTISFQCKSLNGYGGYIKNLYSNSVNVFTGSVSNCEVIGVGILNIFLTGNISPKLFDITASSGILGYAFRKCVFSGRFLNTGYSTARIFTRANSFTSCSFNFIIQNAIYPFDTNPVNNLTYCRIELNYEKVGNGDVIGPEMAPVNCYITGNMAVATSPYPRNPQFTIFDCEMSNISYSGTVVVCIVNSDKLASVPPPYISATTAKLKSAEFLTSVGFPVQT